MAMTVEARATLRSVILPAENAPVASQAGRLLNDLGHDVSRADSPEQAMELLRHDQVDLLVVDVSASARNREFLHKLVELPDISRPREVAIFNDMADDTLRSMRTRLRPSHVHIFLKPLHMHGLLSVLRCMDNEE